MATVAVVIPTRGRGEGLDAALAAIRAPENWLVNVLVIENHTDEAESIARSRGARYERLVGGNASIARNHGARLAAGADAIAFLDDDSVPQGDWLRQLTLPIISGAADATVGACRVQFGKPVPDSVRGYFVDTDLALDPARPFLIGMNMAIKPAVFEALGGFPEYLGPGASIGGEDLLLSYRLTAAGYRLQAVLAATVRHDVPASRLTRKGLLERMTWAGRGEGWVTYHWLQDPPRHLRLRMLRSRVLLLTRPTLERELEFTLRYAREQQMLAESCGRGLGPG